MNAAQLVGLDINDIDLFTFGLLAAKGNATAQSILDEIKRRQAIRVRAARVAWGYEVPLPTSGDVGSGTAESGDDRARSNVIIPFRPRKTGPDDPPAA